MSRFTAKLIAHGSVVALLAAVACSGADEPLLPADEPSNSGNGGNDEDEDLTTSTGTGTSSQSSSASGSPPVDCPYEGPALVDPSTLPACPADICGGGAHCVPTALVPPDQLATLADCDSSTKCVPDKFIETMGNTIPTTCTSFGGSEGRCLSTCVPEVAAQASQLPQDVCGEFDVCVPCYDPFTQEPTGACTLMCDPGPTQAAPPPLPSCCDGGGTCIPKTSIPSEQQESLDEDECPTGEEEESDDDGGTTTGGAVVYPAMLCVPNEMLDGTYLAPPCTTSGLFTGGNPGACYPECLGAVQSIFVHQGDCADGYKCAPCENPLTGADTGACP